jgi:hypothetical protein
MSDLYANLKKFADTQDKNRPSKGTVFAIDGITVDVFIMAHSTVLRHVQTIGVATAIGQPVTLSWDNGVPTAHIVGATAPSPIVQNNILTNPSSQGAPSTGDVDMGNYKIVNLAAPVSPNDAVNKQYTDNYATGIQPAIKWIMSQTYI